MRRARYVGARRVSLRRVRGRTVAGAADPAGARPPAGGGQPRSDRDRDLTRPARPGGATGAAVAPRRITRRRTRRPTHSRPRPAPPAVGCTHPRRLRPHPRPGRAARREGSTGAARPQLPARAAQPVRGAPRLLAEPEHAGPGGAARRRPLCRPQQHLLLRGSPARAGCPAAHAGRGGDVAAGQIPPHAAAAGGAVQASRAVRAAADTGTTS